MKWKSIKDRQQEIHNHSLKEDTQLIINTVRILMEEIMINEKIGNRIGFDKKRQIFYKRKSKEIHLFS